MEELQKKKVVELIDVSIFEIDDQKEVDELKKKKVVELRQIAKDYGIKKISGLCKARLIVVLSNVPEIMEEMRNLQRQRIILNESIPVINDKAIKQPNTEPATNLTQSPPGKNIPKSQPTPLLNLKLLSIIITVFIKDRNQDVKSVVEHKYVNIKEIKLTVKSVADLKYVNIKNRGHIVKSVEGDKYANIKNRNHIVKSVKDLKYANIIDLRNIVKNVV